MGEQYNPHTMPERDPEQEMKVNVFKLICDSCETLISSNLRSETIDDTETGGFIKQDSYYLDGLDVKYKLPPMKWHYSKTVNTDTNRTTYCISYEYDLGFRRSNNIKIYSSTFVLDLESLKLYFYNKFATQLKPGKFSKVTKTKGQISSVPELSELLNKPPFNKDMMLACNKFGESPDKPDKLIVPNVFNRLGHRVLGLLHETL